jgi:hypothetical protein
MRNKMLAMDFMRPRVFAATLAVSALSANAAPPGYDEQGLKTKPVCSYALPENLLSMHKEKPTGEKAQTPDWKIKVYANKEKNTWTLVGTSKDPDADTDKMCRLANGIGDYKAQKWFTSYFSRPDSVPKK